MARAEADARQTDVSRERELLFKGTETDRVPRTAEERVTDFVSPFCFCVIVSGRFRTCLCNRKDPAMHRSRLAWLLLPALVALALGLRPAPVDSACCYFAAKDKDILQPAQKAFLTWDPSEKVETFTVQPKFEGNAIDFGMVIPTPAKPKLDEMPREFFKELAVFTILEPIDIAKYKNFNLYRQFD